MGGRESCVHVLQKLLHDHGHGCPAVPMARMQTVLHVKKSLALRCHIQMYGAMQHGTIGSGTWQVKASLSRASTGARVSQAL